MNLTKAERREQRLQAERRMQVSGRSVKLLQEILMRRAGVQAAQSAVKYPYAR